MFLAARFARVAFSGFGGASKMEGIFSAPKGGKSFDVVRSTLVSDRPESIFDVSKSEFRATRDQSDQSSSDSITPKKPSDSLPRNRSVSDSSRHREADTATSRTADRSQKATDATESNTSTTRESDTKADSKPEGEKRKKTRTERAMKLFDLYQYSSAFDGRSGSRQASSSIDAAATRMLRGDSSASLNDFAPQSGSHNQNGMIDNMLMMHLLQKMRTKTPKTENTQDFHEEFTKRVNEEVTTLRKNAGSNINTIGRSESSRSRENAGSTINTTRRSESSRSSGDRHPTRGRETKGRWA